MDWTHADKYRQAKLVDFVSHGKVAGRTQAYTADKGAGLLRYLDVYKAGHMVPYGALLLPSLLCAASEDERRLTLGSCAPLSRIADQPQVSLDFFTRWIRNESFE